MFGTRDVEMTPLKPDEFVTLADAKAHLGVTGNEQDAKITALIAAASDTIEAYCGRLFSQRAVVERMRAEDAVSALILSHYPAISLGALTSRDAVQTLSDFRLNKARATIRRVDGCGFEPGEHVAEYAAGYAPADMPQGIVEACKLIVADLYAGKPLGDGVVREGVPDVGDVTYETSKVAPVGRNGVKISAAASMYLAPFVSEYSTL